MADNLKFPTGNQWDMGFTMTTAALFSGPFREIAKLREWLQREAEENPDTDVWGGRVAALRAIAERYMGQVTTLRFLLARAEHDPAPGPRGAALRLLAEHYRDDPAARTLLLASADDEDELVRRAAALAWGHLLADDLKRRLLSRDLDGIDPGHDPREPVVAERISEAARRFSRTEAEVCRLYEDISATFPLRLSWLKLQDP